MIWRREKKFCGLITREHVSERVWVSVRCKLQSLLTVSITGVKFKWKIFVSHSLFPSAMEGGVSGSGAGAAEDSISAAKRVATELAQRPQTKTAPDGYFECYPDAAGFAGGLDDSDEDIDWTKMDMVRHKNKKILSCSIFCSKEMFSRRSQLPKK